MSGTLPGDTLYHELFGDWNTRYAYMVFWGDGHSKLRIIRWAGTGADYQSRSHALTAYARYLLGRYPDCREIIPIPTNDRGNTWDGIIDADSAEWWEWLNTAYVG